jgi:hypothetical protein
VADFFRWSEKDVLRRAEHERDLTNLACFIEGPQTQEQRDRLAAALRRVRQRVRARTWRVFTANVLRGRPIGEVAEAYGVECMSVRTTRARVLRYVLRELGEYANRGVDPEDREP